MEYFLKSSTLIIIVYLCYKLLLQRDTFFENNRWYFLAGIILSVVLPLVVIPIYINKTPESTSFIIEQTSGIAPVEQSTTSFNWVLLINTIYLLGMSIAGIRLLIQLFSLASLILRHKKQRSGPYIFVETQDDISPFSFFNWIVFNPSQFKNNELEQIIMHEKVHAQQHHSIDLLLTQIMTVVFWCNPFIWMYKKALEQNLEFIADAETQKQTSCEKSYQQLLLKTSVPNYQMAFTNNFYNSLIKKRIVMLQTSKSHKKNQLKILAILPLLTLFLMSFNTKEIYTEAPIEINKAASIKGEVLEIIISKNMSDKDLDNAVDEFKKSGVSLKFSNIKRNSKKEIIKIGISASSKHSKAKFEAHSEKPISSIIIKYDSDNDSITIGSANANSFSYRSKDGGHVITKSGNGSNVFVHSSHSDDGDLHEIIEDEDKIIIKNNSKTKIIKKDSNSSVHIISDHDDKDHDDDHVHENIIEIDNDQSNGLQLSFGKNKNPLILLDGKEITRKEFKALNSDAIKTVEVIKGDDTMKKYGKKAKHGVVIITSKTKK